MIFPPRPGERGGARQGSSPSEEGGSLSTNRGGCTSATRPTARPPELAARTPSGRSRQTRRWRTRRNRSRPARDVPSRRDRRRRGVAHVDREPASCCSGICRVSSVCSAETHPCPDRGEMRPGGVGTAGLWIEHWCRLSSRTAEPVMAPRAGSVPLSDRSGARAEIDRQHVRRNRSTAAAQRTMT